MNNGVQLCKGISPQKVNPSAAAVVMIGEPFRSRNFKTYKKHMMDDGTLESQHMISQTQVEGLVEPLEKAGVRVDVFLARHSFREDAGELYKDGQRRFSFFEQLNHFYGKHRVVRIVDLNPNRNQFFHVSEMLYAVQNHTVKGGLNYKFLIFIRYDIKT
jgi:hypothetical protein